MSRPAVSILVPIYNVEKYLEECLDSIVNQTLENIEIICINDGSTDSSLKIIKKYAKNDPRIVIINKKNSGYGDSMNKGLEKATGEYIGIVESDDWIEHDAFEKLYKLAKDNTAEVVKSNYYNYYTTPSKKILNRTITYLVSPDEVGRIIDPHFNHHILYQRPAIWAGLYKKSFIDNKNIRFLPSPGASYQDTGFNFKVWATARKAVFTSEAFLHYRQDNETSSVNSPGKVFCISEEYAEIERFLEEYNLLERFGDLMRTTKWGAYAWNIDRLTGALAEEFIKLASKEYSEDYASGIFNYELCDPNQVRTIREIIHNPEMAIRRKYATENAKVSIIIPAYNVETYIEQSVNSALEQTLSDIEIIIIDDGSTDDTADILEEVFTKDPRIKLINTRNRGQSVARNVGIDNARAPYIAFLDSDDYYEPDSIENLYNSLKNSGSDISVGSIRVIYKDKHYTALEKNNDRQYYMVKFRGKQDISGRILEKTDVSPCNKLFRRDLIEQYYLRFPAGLRYEDAFFFNAYAMLAKSISFLPRDQYVYNYIRRPGSTMAETFSKTSINAYDHLEVAICIYEFMKTNNLVKRWNPHFISLFVDYYNFSLRYSPVSIHSRIYERTQGFIAHNKEFLLQAGDTEYQRIKSLLSAQPIKPLSTKDSLCVMLKIKVKDILRPLLPKTSLSYRAQRHILNSITSVHHKIDRIEERQEQLDKHLSRRIEAIEQHLNGL